ncbi:hypothetical protein WJX73_005106 [Symbiochloris irregularis]|uniref:Serine aminopeptidase S33 domain-containing protein n=1 Tax=Symbiochloris irregularis TaxID=706552 RepID=A0AAW1PDB4_9CHLO
MARYTSVHRFWAAERVSVFGFDAHGHGRSEPEDAADRGLVWQFNDLINDAQQFAGMVMESVPHGTPVFLGGQSLGGLIATMPVQRDATRWSGLILCSAAMDVEWTLALRIQKPFAGLLTRLLPREQMVPAANPRDLSKDAKVIQDFMEDPLTLKGKVRVRTAAQILQAFSEAKEQRSRLRLPVFAHHGDGDKITSLPAMREFMAAIPSHNKTLKVVRGGAHELLMGEGFEEHARPISDWILKTCPTARL